MTTGPNWRVPRPDLPVLKLRGYHKLARYLLVKVFGHG